MMAVIHYSIWKHLLLVKWLNEETIYAIMGGFGASIVEEAETLVG